MGADILGAISLVLLLCGTVIALLTYFDSKKRPCIAPEVPLHKQSPEPSFPNVVLVRNRGSAAASNIRGLIFPEPRLSQDPDVASYTFIRIAHLKKQTVITFIVETDGTDVPGFWRIANYPLAPEKTESGVTARLTLTYQDEKGRSYASIFDYKRNRGWRPVARLARIKLDITALEEELQQRKRDNISLLPPPSDGFILTRRHVLISVGGLVVLGVAGVAYWIGNWFLSEKGVANGGPGLSPTLVPSGNPVNNLEDFLANPNPWVLTIAGGIIVAVFSGLILYFGFGVGKTNTDQQGKETTQPKGDIKALTNTAEAVVIRQTVDKGAAYMDIRRYQPPAAEPAPIISKLTPKEIMESLEKIPPFQREYAASQYVGILVSWTVVFLDVAKSSSLDNESMHPVLTECLLASIIILIIRY